MKGCRKSEKCRECAEKIYEWIDGEIDGKTKKKLESQIDDCKGCIGVYEFETALREVVRRNIHVEMPAHIRNRILDAIREKNISSTDECC